MAITDTIVALASGSLPSGIAIIRVSGSHCSKILNTFVNKTVQSGQFSFCNIYDPDTLQIIDQGMVAFFRTPHSFTGEDIIEFHTHGSIAIISKLISCLTNINGVRLAKAGEFTRRAFENEKLDLSRVEAISDLIAAETESQRIIALARLQGNLFEAVDNWRKQLIHLLSVLETQLDFSDEGDIESFDGKNFLLLLSEFHAELDFHLEKFEIGRLVREGFRVGIGGRPNVGKSSIINALSGSNVAIVTSEPGTTRDIKEVRLDIGGQLITIIDSAGIRASDSLAETEGVSRALEMYNTCELVIWVSAPDVEGSATIPTMNVKNIHISNKSDIGTNTRSSLSICAKSGQVSALVDLLKAKTKDFASVQGDILISRKRDKLCVLECKNAIDRAYKSLNKDPKKFAFEFIAEDIRAAIFSLERLVGKVDAEDILGKIFANFCIGK